MGGLEFILAGSHELLIRIDEFILHAFHSNSCIKLDFHEAYRLSLTA